jgi:3-hydroxy acid dehydrogenase / malonic semialdehyde reductase
MKLVVLITGASSGIGRACAELFAREQFDLVLTARRLDRLEELSTSLAEQFGAETICLEMDVRNRHEVEEKLQGLPDRWKRADVLVNNAGLSQGLDPIQDGNPDDWDRMVDTNVKGLLYVTKVVSGWMVKAAKGHIINLGSIAAKDTYANGNVYCATKSAVDALNQGMRIDLLPYGIRVTAVHPGAVETEFSEVRFKGDAERAKKVYEGYEPLLAQDIAETIWFAVSRPAHVNINELTVMPTAQASAFYHLKKGV